MTTVYKEDLSAKTMLLSDDKANVIYRITYEQQMPDLDSCLQIAKSAALLAGDYLKEQQTKNLKILSNNARDLKLQIDIDAEEIIKEHINQKSSLPILDNK